MASLNDKKYSYIDYLSNEIQLNKGSPPAEIARQFERDPFEIRKAIKKCGVFVIKTDHGNAHAA